MNIIRYKNIDDIIRKKDIYLGQEIDKDELKLITKGYVPTKFNVGINDVLEFSLYDSSNNLLIQESFGPVRYIRGDKIKDYLLISNNPDDIKGEGGGFVVDTKRLIKEAGFNTGYFRVQLNFVNNRVGSEYEKDRVWIQEISPTRLELRLLPFNNFNDTDIDKDIKNDLNQSYDSFLEGKFSGDEVYQEIYNILDSIKAIDISNMLKTVLTQSTIEKLKQEFSLREGYDIFYARVLDDMKKAVINELLYRNSTIGSSDFGKPISDIVRNKISQKDYNYYTKQNIVDLLYSKFKESVTFHLPKRSLDETIRLSAETIKSLDKLKAVVQKLESDVNYQLPQIQKEIIQPIPPPIVQAETATPPPPTTPQPLKFLDGPTVVSTENSATITFRNSEESSAEVEFLDGLCPIEGCIINKSTFSSGKRILVTGLLHNTTYKFVAKSKTSDGRMAMSEPITFTTLPQISREPVYDPYLPVIDTRPTSRIQTNRNAYVDLDGNPNTIEGRIGDYTEQIK